MLWQAFRPTNVSAPQWFQRQFAIGLSACLFRRLHVSRQPVHLFSFHRQGIKYTRQCLVSSLLRHRMLTTNARVLEPRGRSNSPFSERVMCWRCQAPVVPTQSVVCAQCGITQKCILTLDHFTLFNLPLSFAFSENLLDTAYKKLQQKLHPDRFAQDKEALRNTSLELSAHVNAAYSTLKDQFSRAHYILHCLGASLREDQTHDQSHEGLEQIMELQEQLEMATDQPANSAARTVAIHRVLHQSQISISHLSESLDNSLVQQDTNQARQRIEMLVYFLALRKQCMEHLPVT